MNAKKMLLGLLPWVVFSVLTQRAGTSAVGIAAVAAVALSAYFMATDGRGHRLKIIPVTGVIGFGVIAVLAFSGGQGMSEWLADYGRGASAPSQTIRPGPPLPVSRRSTPARAIR